MNFAPPRLFAKPKLKNQVYQLNFDWKIPMTCRIRCVDGLTGSAPVSESKQEQDVPQRRCYVHCVGGMLEKGVPTCNLFVRVVITRICVSARNII